MTRSIRTNCGALAFWALVATVVTADPVWPIGAVCNPNGGPLERAQCSVDAAGQNSASRHETWQPNQVPGFVTDQPPEIGYFDTSGNPVALDQAAIGASQSATANELRDRYDQAAGWDLSASPPAETARAVRSQPSIDPGLSETCRTIVTCVSWQETPVGGGSCQTPGVRQDICHIVETPTATSMAMTVEGTYTNDAYAGDIIGYCIRYRWVAAGRVTVNRYMSSCPGLGPVIAAFDAAPPPLVGTPLNVAESMTIVLTVTCGNPAGNHSRTHVLSVSNHTEWFGGACSGGYMRQRFTWTYRRTGYDITTTVADGCQEFRSLGEAERAALERTTCVQPGDTVVTASDGASVTVPLSYSTRGCWRESQTWVIASEVPDTCGVYREQGCAQVSSVCGRQDPYGNCEYYDRQYQCMGQTCAAEQTVRVCATCGDPSGLVPFCLDDETPPDDSLMKTAAWLQVLQNAKQQWDPDRLTIFNGERVQCVHGAGFGNMLLDNCCADPPSGDCTQGEWDAYAARRARRTQYVGEYCSNWVNFLVGRMCVEYTMVWCAYPTSFARIIHQQGRPALPRGWGTPEAPDCGPFTIDEFQRLPFDRMDFSELYHELLITNDQQGLAGNARQAASEAAGR